MSSHQLHPVVQHNPFATRFTRPGALAYCFPPGQSMERLCQRLAECHWQGQIVGPHGSGKSTLLRGLIEALAQRGRRAALVQIAPPEYGLPRWDGRELAGHALLAVDGYDQLGRIDRWRLRLKCRRYRMGLVATAHRDTGLPLLITTAVSLEQATDIVRQLLHPRPVDQALRAALAELLVRHQSNMREVLFALFDAFRSGRL